jgi:hypothetical protein
MRIVKKGNRMQSGCTGNYDTIGRHKGYAPEGTAKKEIPRKIEKEKEITCVLFSGHIVM